MGSVEKFYLIIEEKQGKYKNVFEFLRTFLSDEKEILKLISLSESK